MGRDGETAVGLVVFAILAAMVWIIGSATRWSFFGDREYLDLACPQDAALDAQHRCVGPVTPNGLLHVRINASARSVLVAYDNPSARPDAGTSYGSLGTPSPLLLKDCAVIDDDNWTCELPTWGVATDPVNTAYGVSDGRYYHSLTSSSPPNFYHSSLTGLWLLLYRTRAWKLEQAVRSDGFAGLVPPPLIIAPVERSAPPPEGNSISNSTVPIPMPPASDGDRPATIAEVEAHGGRWIGGKLFYGTCPPGVWVGSNRLPPLKDLCPPLPPTTDVPATPGAPSQAPDSNSGGNSTE